MRESFALARDGVVWRSVVASCMCAVAITYRTLTEACSCWAPAHASTSLVVNAPKVYVHTFPVSNLPAQTHATGSPAKLLAPLALLD